MSKQSPAAEDGVSGRRCHDWANLLSLDFPFLPLPLARCRPGDSRIASGGPAVASFGDGLEICLRWPICIFPFPFPICCCLEPRMFRTTFQTRLMSSTRKFVDRSPSPPPPSAPRLQTTWAAPVQRRGRAAAERRARVSVTCHAARRGRDPLLHTHTCAIPRAGAHCNYHFWYEP